MGNDEAEDGQVSKCIPPPPVCGSGAAGLPTTVAWAGTSRTTTEPAPTIAPSPIVTPGRIVAFAPMLAPRRTVVV